MDKTRRSMIKNLGVLPLVLFSVSLLDTNLRKVEVKTTNGWTRTEMKHLKPGDMFRMFEPDDTQVYDKKRGTEFKVIGKPYFKNNVWGVNCE